MIISDQTRSGTKPDFNISPQTLAAQSAASDPSLSAWVSANAGSGKTTVLVRRVLRLLLAGVAPSRIVCLTYTKAAAANMKIRLFSDLREWAAISNDELVARLADLSGLVPPTRISARARTLFALALETPGGLKIDTIHGFCTRLLQSAPFEANVPAGFEILKDADAIRLHEDALRDVLINAARNATSCLGKAMHRVAQDTEETRFAELTDQIISNRALLCDDDGMLLPLNRLEARIMKALNVSADDCPEGGDEAFAAQFMAEYAPDDYLEALISAFAASTPKDQAQASRIRAARVPTTRQLAFEALGDVFITEKGPRAALFTAPFAKTHPALSQRLDAMAEPYLAASNRLKAISACGRSLALMRVAHAVLKQIDSLKSRRRMLDFEDIILRTRSLLTRVEASWVLYKLDSGIDHVLIDEAQDTSGVQWDIIKAITADFFSGSGATQPAGKGHLLRTIFAVGDEKQSIYSFQKAEPAAFDAMRAHFFQVITPLADHGYQFRSIRLDQSFRLPRS